MRKLFVLLAILFMQFPQAAAFVAGKDYVEVANPDNASGKRVQEFFSYGCPWCHHLEKDLEPWRQRLSRDVEFSRVPVVFEAGWDQYAKAYYVAKAMRIETKMTPVLFDAIQDENTPIQTQQGIIELFAKHGADKALVISAFTQSPPIDAKLVEGMNLMKRFRVYAVPTFVVNGRYRTDLKMSNGDTKRLLKIVKFLLEQKR